MIYNGHRGLDDLAQTVKQVALDISPYKSRFDIIVVRGMSGVLIGSPVSVQLGIPLVIVRKDGDSSHSSRPLINEHGANGKYLFLDDFISLGYTFHAVRKAMREHSSAEYAGTYLYEHRLLSWDGDGGVSYRERHDRHEFDLFVNDPPEQPLITFDGDAILKAAADYFQDRNAA